MTTIPLGIGAYKRTASGSPEIKLINRFLEKSPTNLEEHSALLGRPGTTLLDTFSGGVLRRAYSRPGLFNSDLFVVSGNNLYRYTTNGTKQQITGTVYGDGAPSVTWMKGEGYEFMFIADGLLLQYYDGGTRATQTLTLTPSSPPDISTQTLTIGTAVYAWSATPAAGTQDGTSSHPWLAKTGATDAESLANMADLINFAGVPGTDFSTSLPGPNLDYTATATATTLVVTAIDPFVDGSGIVTTKTGLHIAWGGATMSGGDVHLLRQVEVPDGAAVKSLTWLASFVLASIGNSRKFFWIEPGDVIIDALNFAEKESSSDNINDMLTVGDNAFIMGSGSSEFWYATGDLDAPFAPIKGQSYQRGVLEGTAVVVKDTVVFVGDDSIVYALGANGAQPLSDSGINERIRTQLRREGALP